MSSVPVRTAEVSERPAAVGLLVAHLPDAERPTAADRVLTRFAVGDLDPAGLLVASVGGVVAGAVFVQRLPGATAGVWPPGVAAGAEEIADALAAGAIGRIRGFGVGVAHAFGREPERPRFAALERAGFRRVTALTFLTRLSPGASGVSPGNIPSDLRFTPAGPTPAFAELLLATYDGTLDCPELNGTRSGADVLAGYTAGGVGDWFVVARGGEPVGVLMFSSPAVLGVVELGYLGLIPAARGAGLGGAIVRFALRHAAATGADAVSLSVDVRNRPAVRLYADFGFRELDRQDVYLWTPPGPAGPADSP